MRDPFQLPEDCAPVSFDIDIVPDPLPICSLPPFTDPTLIIPTKSFSIPYAPPPWNCFTIPPYETGASARPLIDRYAFNIEVRVFPISHSGVPFDACNPSYGMSILPEIPCLPLSVSATAIVQILPIDDPVIQFTMRRVSGDAGCKLETELDVELPCMPFNPRATVVITPIDQGNEPTGFGTFYKSIEGSGSGGECELILELDLHIPTGCAAFRFVSDVVWNNGIDVYYQYVSKNCSVRDDGSTHIIDATDCPPGTEPP